VAYEEESLFYLPHNIGTNEDHQSYSPANSNESISDTVLFLTPDLPDYTTKIALTEMRPYIGHVVEQKGVNRKALEKEKENPGSGSILFSGSLACLQRENFRH